MKRALLPLLLCACPAASPGVRDPGRVDDLIDTAEVQLQYDIAQLEARRGAGIDGLVERATHGRSTHERALALRGLGRIGGLRSLTTLREALADPDAAIVNAAAGAIGIVAALDEPSPDDVAPLVAAQASSKGDATVILEALGRVAPGPIATITAALKVDATAEAAALACGRLGRRKIALDPAARHDLAGLTRSARPAVRYAAAYALSREVIDPDATRADAADALAPLVEDPEAEVRATAIAGLAKHAAIHRARKAIEDSLLDRDWRVAVEAVRALIGEHGDDAGRDAVAAALVRRFAGLTRGDLVAAQGGPQEQVVIEALRELLPYGARPLVQSALGSVVASVSTAKLPATSRQWIRCLALDGLGRTTGTLATLAPCDLPDWLRLPLLAESHVGTLAERRDLLAQLLAHHDVRVRIAALSLFATLWKESDAADHHAGVATVAGALASPDPVYAGAAVDAAGALYDLADADDRATLAQAIVVRATMELEPELGSALLELISDKKLGAGIVACRAALPAHPVRARAAAKCMAALGEAVQVGPIPAATPPPIDVATVLGKHLVWRLATDRGDIAILLRPEAAPWAVATIVTLTRRGFYDRQAVHRVVPNFVVQGGDPTETGGGGPGFLLPAEPSTGAGFATGGIGMADAGRDSGGSQWFAMHGRAPHLDGRYTWVGVVIGGQAVADSLQIGDRVLKATISDH